MNTRIEKDFYFHAALHFEKEFYINTYDLTLSMLIETACAREQQIAIDRIDFYLKNIFTNCIFVHMLDDISIQKYQTAGLRVCQIPEEPWDQVIAMVLLTKLNAIMENRIKITDMVLGSIMSEGVRYSIVSEEAENVLSGKNWWNTATLSVNNDDYCQGENVVKLFYEDEWASLNLSWREKTN